METDVAAAANLGEKHEQLLDAFDKLHQAYQHKCFEMLQVEKANTALQRDVAYLTTLYQ